MVCKNDYVCDLLNRAGLSEVASRTVANLAVRGLRILVIALVALVISRLAARLVRRSVNSVLMRAPLARGSARAEQRARTIAGVSVSVVRIVVWGMAGLQMIDVLGFNLGPLLAGAGIVGIALGFGAQSLVRDFLSGFFILVEDQYGVGDFVRMGEQAEGTVEEVNLRITRLRASDGTVWFVPNGEVRRIGNVTMQWSRAVVDVTVPFETDVDAARAAIADEAAAFAAEESWSEAVVDEPEVWGVEVVEPDGILLRTAVKTVPQRRLAVARALRLRLASRLQADGIIADGVERPRKAAKARTKEKRVSRRPG